MYRSILYNTLSYTQYNWQESEINIALLKKEKVFFALIKINFAYKSIRTIFNTHKMYVFTNFLFLLLPV